MLNRILPKKIEYYLELIRFRRPIGFTLLMWPCWFALAILEKNQVNLINFYILFLIGSFTMRSAGCIINDIIDINIDKKVSRTSSRPLASKKISLLEALTLLLILLIISFIILLQFKLNVILVGLISIPLIILYPYMKRFTYWPQLILGLIFNWGILIVSYQFHNNFNLNFLLLYIACVFWTLAYDTIYAYQDRYDDINNNIKSTAVLFGSIGRQFVYLFYFIFLMIIAYLGYISSGTFFSIFVIITFIFALGLYFNKWKIESKNSSNYYFKFNNYIGLFCFVFLIVF